ncbi:type II secretion system protein GspK [Pseudomonas aeruginosa]|uniref:general secretion pathway protein GspK n=1 Tax=Pseudomonas aeruginosa TaxID=287 RepID=UPI001A18E832|nr:general secretion pathway protein GspK [Pseudomonas aeruginosa]HBO3000345.1 general secretion pathway protein GspK [Pseudomonas aeruginosa]
MISDGARRHAASARSSGFVLVGVVWFLAIMTLLASAAVLWVGRSLDATENRRKVLLRELEEHALLARVQWLVATQRYTVAGLSVPGNAGAAPSKVDMDTSILPIGGELPLDGREFCMANGWCVALLDRSARLSLSGIDPRVLSRLLAGLGVPAEQVQVMVAQWFSYLYPGAAPRLGSAAQASDRSSPGQARRRPLRSVMEVFRLEAWRPWEAHLLDAGWRDLVAADEAALNINTADARLLSLAWGLPEDAVGRLLQARWQRPFTRMSDLHDVLGGHARLVPEDGWARLASPVLSIRLYPPGAEQGTEYEVRFNSEHRLLPPWQLLSKRSVKINDRYSNPPLHPDIAPGVLAAPLVARPW